MGRPAGYSWAPLGWDTDPVPGDPLEITVESELLTSVVTKIQEQVQALQKIANDQVNVGKTAEKIRSAASDLVGSLQAIENRYLKVSAALIWWAQELYQAQSMSLQALNDAEAPYARLSQAFVMPASDSLNVVKMQADIDADNKARQKAQGELDTAKALLSKAINLRDEKGSYYAGVINRASSDSLSDSWWDKFENWVSDYAWLIRDICTALEVLATVAAVLALIFSGVGWIVLLGVALTAVALIGRGMLAATGNGSWADFAVDAFALLTFSIGGGVTKVLGKTVENMATLAKGMQTAKAADMLDSFGNVVGEAARKQVLAKFLEKTVPKIEESAKTTFWERLRGAGDPEVVNMMKTAAKLSEKFGKDSQEIKALADQAKLLQNALRVNFVASNADGIGSLAGGGIEFDGPNGPTAVNWHIPGLTELYNNFIEKPTTTNGLSTTAANDIVDVATVVAPPIGLPLQGFRWALSSL